MQSVAELTWICPQGDNSWRADMELTLLQELFWSSFLRVLFRND